ncbi:unnamed protein product, partial [Hydatigera taeniaeformis]|uniref:A2M_recep domain-containing protein n=1 Tax=Hydatigena taeniaeformis TaxID=6205 RepID=A0A0R3WUI0_HYDTA
MKISIPDIQIVEGSLRSYLTVSGNIVGRALTNLDSLIQLPTGCGEQNLVKVAPSVYVLRYLLNRRCNNTNKTNNSHYDHVMKKAASYILSGFDNQLTYRHPENGAFSIWGPQQDSNGSTWLTAYVFHVFSEAEMLPIISITGQSLDAHATLSTAFDFLSGQQRVSGDGCFEEPRHRFLPWMHNPNDVVTRLHLTAHVLAALGSASTALREAKGQAFTSCVRSAIKCIDSAARQLPFTQWPTLLLAKVVHATSAFPHEASSSVYKAMVAELKRRSVLQSTISGSLRWWPESTSAITTTSTSHLTKVLRLETTAYALMALAPIHLSQQDQLATMKWISQQQNEKGGFYSTQDTVVALRALAYNAASFPSPVQPTLLSIHSTPKPTVHAQLEVSAQNNLVAHTFEIGPHNLSDITTLRVTMQSSQPVCVSAHFTTIYNVPEPRRQEDVFELDVSVDQGGNTATAACTTALTTVCLRTARAHATGILLVTVQLPSGWMVTRGELGKAPLNADVQKVELDAQKQVVSAYFNGFSEKDESAERCFTVASHQRAFVEEVQPGLVTARDYYNPREMVQAPLNLNACQLYWNSIRDGVVITNIPSPSSLNFSTTSTVSDTMKSSPKCPKCGKMEPTILIDHLNKSLCFHERQFYIFFTHGGTNRTVA